MALFDIEVRGKGIDLPSAGDPITGLLARRKVRARSEGDALDKLKLALTREWQQGKWQRRNRGSAPHFEVESLTRLPWWKAPFVRAPKRGFDFYSLEEETSAKAA
ncbi:MAG: hypothetical protein AAF830_17615 [Pseudomonadota bacterium]